jgi:uncharacterized membrane protein
MTIFSLVRLLVLFLAALATGALMVNWIGLARAMARLSSPTYVEFHQATNDTFDPYMPIVVVGAALGGIVLAALPPGLTSLSGRLALLGAFCYAAILVISLATGVRMNRQIAGWPIAHPPENWMKVRARWIRFHILRTLVSVPALLSYLASVMLLSGGTNS